MNFWDKVLRLLGTNRVRAAWRWQNFKESFGKKQPEGPAVRRTSAGSSLIPEGFPLATVLILGVCLVFYFLTVQMTNDMADERGIDPSRFALAKYGAAYTPLVLEGGEWFRLFAAVFLHGGLWHILMNSMSLWTLGNSVEDLFGRARMLVIFVVTGAAGMWLAVWLKVTLVVGASGGLFGLLGALLGYTLRHKNSRTARELKSHVIQWLLLGAIISFMPGVSLLAHLGGVVTGVVMGFFMGERGQARRLRYVWELLALLAIGVVAYSFVLAQQSPYVQM